MGRRISRWLTTAALCSACAACGGTDVGRTTGGPLIEEAPPGPVRAGGAQEARAEVGPAGGTLTLTNGARLVIPEGALSAATDVQLQVGADGRAFADAERQRALGPMLAVLPPMVAEGGATFELSIHEQPIPDGYAPADLALAIEEVEDDPRDMGALGTQTRWQFFPVVVEEHRFVARVAGFPGHRVQFGVAR